MKRAVTATRILVGALLLIFGASETAQATSTAEFAYVLYKNGNWTFYDTFQNAYTALGQTSTSFGTIYLPPSTAASPIRLTSGTEILLYDQQSLVGQGYSSFVAPPSGSDATADVVKFMGPNAVVKNLTLIRTTTSVSSTTGSGINLNGYSGTIDGVTFQYHAKGIYDSTNSTTLANLSISTVYMLGVKSAFVDIGSGGTGSVNGIHIQHSLFQDSGGTGLAITTSGSTANELLDVSVQYCVNDVAVLKKANWYLKECHFDSGGGHSLSLVGVTASKITDGVFSASGITVTAPTSWTSNFTTDYATRITLKDGINVDKNCDDVTISHNYITYNAGNGIQLVGASSASVGPDDIKILENTITSNSMKTADNAAGIYINGDTVAMDHIQVLGNRVYNDSALGTNQKYGLRIDGTINYLMYSTNDLVDSNHSSGNLADTSTGSNRVTANNFN